MIHTKIRNKLKATYTQYSNYRHSCFERWCHIYATKKGLCKRLLVNHEGVYNWYCDQWNTIVEASFYNDNKDYIESTIDHPVFYWDLFKNYPTIIHQYFPCVLLTMIKKKHNTTYYELN